DLFSTTICWPSARDKYSPTRRAPTSVEPPAGNGTMKRIGRFGHSCAFAVGMATRIASNATTKRNFTIGKWSRSPYGSSTILSILLPSDSQRYHDLGRLMPFSTYLPKHMGSIRLTPSGPFVAGAYAELTFTYTAGTCGIDDTGMVKISWRTTSDMSKPQFD